MDTNNPRDGNRQIAIIRRIIHLSRHHFQLCSSLLEETGIGSGQVPVLMELERSGELNQRELAEKTRVTPATMSGTLKRMERAGLIVRTADENDARVSRVRLTEEGYAQCGSAHKGFDRACRQMLEGLSDEEMETLSTLLSRIRTVPCAELRRPQPPVESDEE